MNTRPQQTREAAEYASSFVTDIGRSLTCTICVRPLYEPYTSACGHTHCYSCLCLWFASCGRDKTCADCRTPINTAPAPAYLIRELTHKLTSTAEFLPEGETVQQHADQRAEEAAKVEADKQNADAQTGGLFKGMFRNSTRLDPLRDTEDGVDRCPLCHWELEDDTCIQCGYTDLDYEGDVPMEVLLRDEHDMTASDSDSDESLTYLGDMVARHRQHEDDDSEDEDTDSEMESFIDDEDSELGDDSDDDSEDHEEGDGETARRPNGLYASNHRSPISGTYTSDEDADNPMTGTYTSDEEEQTGPKRGTYTSDEESENAGSARRGTYTSDEDETGPRRGTYTSDEEEAGPRRGTYTSDEEEAGPKRGTYTSDEESGHNDGSNASSSSSSTATFATPRPSQSRRSRRVVSSDADDDNSDDDDEQELTTDSHETGDDDDDDDSSDDDDDDEGPVRPVRSRRGAR